jgi:hypothetical protein
MCTWVDAVGRCVLEHGSVPSPPPPQDPRRRRPTQGRDGHVSGSGQQRGIGKAVPCHMGVTEGAFREAGLRSRAGKKCCLRPECHRNETAAGPNKTERSAAPTRRSGLPAVCACRLPRHGNKGIVGAGLCCNHAADPIGRRPGHLRSSPAAPRSGHDGHNERVAIRVIVTRNAKGWRNHGHRRSDGAHRTRPALSAAN